MYAGGPGSGCRGPNCGRPPGRVSTIQKSEFPLTRAQHLVETRFRAQVVRDPEAMKAEYRRRFGNVLNADNAKELSKDYQRNRTDGAAAVHEPASWLMKKMYAEELAKPAPAGKDNTVFFTAGGAGAGKTSAVETNPEINREQSRAQIVYDGTLRPAKSALAKIQQALDAGKRAQIVFTYRDPVAAFEKGVLGRADRQEKALGSGRTVMLDEFAAQHSSIQDSMRSVYEKYKDDPRVELKVLHNGEDRTVREMGLHDLPPAPDKAELRAKLLNVLEKAKASGAISPRIYQATKGAGATKEIGM